MEGVAVRFGTGARPQYFHRPVVAATLKAVMRAVRYSGKDWWIIGLGQRHLRFSQPDLMNRLFQSLRPVRSILLRCASAFSAAASP